jgi:hypothetical protein
MNSVAIVQNASGACDTLRAFKVTFLLNAYRGRRRKTTMARDRFLIDVCSPREVAIHASGNTKEEAEVNSPENEERGSHAWESSAVHSPLGLPECVTIKIRMSKI